ncbi:purine nucleoside permease [Halomarina pelagica]|uniref:purine nucleoside permease n=1 Tax=Halomarina pelagica TaxID=2961599 RepID=UPI0020C255E4|nr:purine nucleoside permease [Halomarina sp. BND7]
MTHESPVELRALVLPAFSFEWGDAPSELAPWLDRYDVAREIAVPGAADAVRCTDRGIGVATTGMGKAQAAATVTALHRSPRLDLSRAYVVTAGVAGGSPSAGTIGSVFLADAVADWDRKFRWDPDGGEGDGEGPTIGPLPFDPEPAVYRLNADLVAAARRATADVTLRDLPEARAYRERYPQEAARGAPAVEVGTTLCGDEFWHGERLAAAAEELVEGYGVGPHATTEMEDYGTALALDRVGRLDRYLNVRAVANFDRPAPGQSARESIDEDVEAFVGLAVENAFRVASAFVEHVTGRWEAYRDGVPSHPE